MPKKTTSTTNLAATFSIRIFSSRKRTSWFWCHSGLPSTMLTSLMLSRASPSLNSTTTRPINFLRWSIASLSILRPVFTSLLLLLERLLLRELSRRKRRQKGSINRPLKKAKKSCMEVLTHTAKIFSI